MLFEGDRTPPRRRCAGLDAERHGQREHSEQSRQLERITTALPFQSRLRARESHMEWFFLILCGYRNLYDAITLRKHSRIPRNAAWKKMPGENPRLNQIPLALSMRYIRLEVSIATENEADPV